MAFVLVPVAGTGRGRTGPPSAPLVVPVGELPAAPAAPTLDHSETHVRVTWQAPAEGQTLRVVRTTPRGEPLPGDPLTPTPASATEVTIPVEFGREVCVALRGVETTGGVTVEGNLSPPGCLTPVDRYPPAAPTDLRALQEGTAIVLAWSAVSASDLAGYVVLRGTGEGESLQPLMREPIRETTYRDTAVQPGVTYVYAVYATDNTSPPNVSQLSNRQSVVVR
jgi:hypothetical protein